MSNLVIGELLIPEANSVPIFKLRNYPITQLLNEH